MTGAVSARRCLTEAQQNREYPQASPVLTIGTSVIVLINPTNFIQWPNAVNDLSHDLLLGYASDHHGA